MDAFDWDELGDEDQLETFAASSSTPIFVAWYSGGFHKEKGEELLTMLLDSVKREFLHIDTLVLHYPDVYDIEGEGSDPWPSYVDRLIQEIDQEPSRAGRPLILFGHSRGNAPAMTVAARLGQRVLKIYLAASDAPVIGEPSPFQRLSERFKREGDLGLLEWFVSLNPGNRAMESLYTSVASGEMKIEDSKFGESMITLMRRQYKDAIWPDMERDFKGVCSPIMAFRPEHDPSSTRAGMDRWKEWTTSSARAKVVIRATHMGILGPQMIDGQEECVMIEEILKDMKLVIAAC
mmetsp:Transcript_129245/g.326233  ORF Transcript_129245/g.326233 Transcript_129245/m.326233 type:complete len:292 (+) Transcript_129245:80-955(+)